MGDSFGQCGWFRLPTAQIHLQTLAYTSVPGVFHVIMLVAPVWKRRIVLTERLH